jgi:hypothetical protein
LKRYVVMLAVMALLMVALAVPAFAAGQGKPEDVPRGQVERGPANANSECSFSGLNDFDPKEPPGGQVQSFGQIASSVAKSGGNVNAGEGRAIPGFACNGNLSPLQEGR